MAAARLEKQEKQAKQEAKPPTKLATVPKQALSLRPSKRVSVSEESDSDQPGD